ncbi:alpha-2 adrenergic receptor [Trichonephila clavipes]|nr:alpha-2 adrenergic receptor [Trichonephila clavipes]
MIVQFRNEKVSNHGSIPITIDCNVVAFIVFEEGFHQPLKRTKQSVFLDVTVFRHTLVYVETHTHQMRNTFTPNAAVLFVDVAIQPEVRFIAKQNSLMKIGNNGNPVLGPFDESTPCLMIVLMNCQTKLRINHLTAVKSVAILESYSNGRTQGVGRILMFKGKNCIQAQLKCAWSQENELVKRACRWTRPLVTEMDKTNNHREDGFLLNFAACITWGRKKSSDCCLNFQAKFPRLLKELTHIDLEARFLNKRIFPQSFLEKFNRSRRVN